MFDVQKKKKLKNTYLIFIQKIQVEKHNKKKNSNRKTQQVHFYIY